MSSRARLEPRGSPGRNRAAGLLVRGRCRERPCWGMHPPRQAVRRHSHIVGSGPAGECIPPGRQCAYTHILSGAALLGNASPQAGSAHTFTYFIGQTCRRHSAPRSARARRPSWLHFVSSVPRRGALEFSCLCFFAEGALWSWTAARSSAPVCCLSVCVCVWERQPILIESHVT